MRQGRERGGGGGGESRGERFRQIDRETGRQRMRGVQRELSTGVCCIEKYTIHSPSGNVPYLVAEERGREGARKTKRWPTVKIQGYNEPHGQLWGGEPVSWSLGQGGGEG